MNLKRIMAFGVAALVVVIVAGIGGWWFFIREDNKLATAAPAIPADLRQTAPAGGAPTASSGALTFNVLSDRSEAAFFADEKLASLPLPSTAKGTTSDVQGSFTLTPDGFDLDTSKPSSFAVNLKTLKSDKEMRDNRIQGVALQTDTYPVATFTATKITGYDKTIAPGDEQTMQLTGMMDLHGVQKEVTWDVKGRRDGNVITALATVKFPFADFNIPVLNVAGFVSVQDSVTLQVQVVAQAS